MRQVHKIMPIGDVHHTIKTLEVETGVTLVTEEIHGYNTQGSHRYRNNYIDYRRNNYRGLGPDRNRSRSLDRQDRSKLKDRSISHGMSQSGSRASTCR